MIFHGMTNRTSGGLYPDASAMRRGEEMSRLGKEPVSIDTYSADVFDMHSAEDRARYSGLMLDLFPRIQAGSCIVWRNELQVLSRPDGSTGWMRYLEWSDYRVNDPGSPSPPERERGGDVVEESLT